MQPSDQIVDARDYLRVLSRHRLLIAIAVFLAGAAAAAYSFAQTTMYTGVAQVVVNPVQFPGVVSAPTVPNLDTEATLARSSSVAVAADRALGLTQAERRLTVDILPNSAVLQFSYSDTEPSRAAQGANAFAQSYVDSRRAQALAPFQRAESLVRSQMAEVQRHIAILNAKIAGSSGLELDQLTTQRASLIAQAGILGQRLADLGTGASSSASAARVIQPATEPKSPSSPQTARNVLAGLVLGAVLGIGLAFIRERLDERVAVGENLERALGAPTLAAIPHMKSWRNRNETPAVTISEGDGETAEAYRAARTSLLFLIRETDARVIEITGPIQNEGKTTTTANLAVALAKGGNRVIAVSCDLRKPRLHRFFGLDNSVGVSSVLSGEADFDEALVQTDVPNLRVMTSGPLPGNPGELLGSDAMDDLFARLRKEADIVLVDTPPALVVSDGLELAPKVDGILIVANATLSNRGSIAQARQRLERAGGTIIAGILNDLDPSKGRPHRGYGYRRSHRPYRYRGEEPGPDMQPIVPEPDPDGHEPGAIGWMPPDAHEWRTTAATSASRQQPPHRRLPNPEAQNPDP